MPTRCVINGCESSYNKNKQSTVSLHRFPKVPDVKKLWEEFVTKQNSKEYQHHNDHRLCSLHFSKDSFIDRELKFRSVPTVPFYRHDTSDEGWHREGPVQLNDINASLSSEGSASTSMGSLDRSSTPAPKLQDSQDQENVCPELDPVPLNLSCSPVPAQNMSASESSDKKFYSPGEIASRMRERGRKRSIEDFTVDDFDTPRKRARNLEKLKELSRKKEKKLKCSRQIASRWKGRAASLKDVMKELKENKLITEDVKNVIEVKRKN